METEELAKIIYEACRVEAEWSGRSIVPEKYKDRDEKFRKQFIEIVNEYLSADQLPNPEEAHNSWVEAHRKMGWKYGEKRNQIEKTHPDIVPFEELPKDEKDKDAIFLIIIWVVKELFKNI